MNKTIYCTLDTETVGGAVNPKGMYNVGAIIHDRDCNIIATTSLLVMEHYDDIRTDDYAKQNFHLYAERLANGEISAVATEAEAFAVVDNLCKFYGVKYVMCFNTGFDLSKTCFRGLLEHFEFIDLWLMAVQTITHKKGYAEFCRANGYRAKNKGKSCATSAESVFAYITNNPDYVEEHTALADALIEMEIFKACLKMHKKFTKNCHCWDAPKGSNKCFPRWSVGK